MKKLLFVASLIIFFGFTQTKKISWVAIGDSITYLNDHANETGNRVEKGYLTRVTEQLPDVTYTNQGHNGWTAVRIATEIENLGIQKADVYTVFLGTNDWWGSKTLGIPDDYKNNTGVNTVYGSFRIIIDKLHTLNSDAKIILITPMQRGDFVYINGAKNNAFGSYKEKNGMKLEQFADAVKQIGTIAHIPVIDLYHNKSLNIESMVKFKRLKNAQGAYENYAYPKYIDVPFNPETDEYPYPAESIDMTYDGLHPSDKGNAVIADLVVKEMKKLK